MIPGRMRTSFFNFIPKRFKNFDDVDNSDINQPLSIFARVDVKFPSRANGDMQCFIFLDMTGCKMEAVAMGAGVDHLNRVVFRLSQVTDFQNIASNYKCYLADNTIVEPFKLPIQFPPYPKHLIPFPQVFSRPDRTYVDIAGMIVHWGELEYIGTGANRRQLREIVVIDESHQHFS